jgi:hypothetical protein
MGCSHLQKKQVRDAVVGQSGIARFAIPNSVRDPDTPRPTFDRLASGS